jgi:UDP-3-O-acyl-N-acetylglucosamine deacetylase
VEHVVARQRRTSLQRGEAVVEMVEHVLAALAGLRIDNCRVVMDGPETPGLDGSSLGFVEALDAAGIAEQDRPRATLVIRRPLVVQDGPSRLAAEPGGDSLELTYQLDYGATAIGRQSYTQAIAPERFRSKLAPSRTFLLAAEAESLRAAGVGRRTTESDLLIFGPDGPVGYVLRFPDECARPKVLVMVGDFALLGMDLVGRIVASRTGHQHNAELVRCLLQSARAELAA